MRKKWLLAIPVVLLIAYAVGPAPKSPVFNAQAPVLPDDLQELQKYVEIKESSYRLKPDNEARIVWANDSMLKKTPYSFVYLHGFSASQAEGEPSHRNIAKAFNSNLFLSRLAEHGTDTTLPMMNLTADNYYTSAAEAIAIGKKIGEKVIVIGTSTGGTLALQLAAAKPADIYAIILMSPNIAINNDKAYLLNNHWGLQLARVVNGSDFVVSKDTRPVYKQYWHHKYPLEATAQLQEMLETAMTEETFKKVKQPLLMMYYFRDEVHQDSVVKVDAMLKMFDQLGTPADKKRKVAMPTVGDHVMGSYIKSKDLDVVQKTAVNFLKEIGVTSN